MAAIISGVANLITEDVRGCTPFPVRGCTPFGFGTEDIYQLLRNYIIILYTSCVSNYNMAFMTFMTFVAFMIIAVERNHCTSHPHLLVEQSSVH